MNDLISRAYVLAEYDRKHQGPPGGARKIMEEAPAVDAVPVIRCKVCKHWVCADTVGAVRYGDCTNKQSIISKHAMPNENYFCADGERRDGDA